MKKYKSLQEIFALTPHIKLASESDNEAILKFYQKTEMKSDAQSIKYGRSDNFFSFLKERCIDNLVFTLWNDSGELTGVAVVSYRQGYINGELQTVGYLGDLRVGLNRKLIREWRLMFSLFIEHSKDLPETKFCKYYQTAIIDQNKMAKSNLVFSQIDHVHYSPIEKYKMVNIVGQIKLFQSNKYKITHISNDQIEQIIDFLELNEQRKEFGRHWESEFKHRIEFWNNFTLNNFKVVKSENGELLAVCNWWNPIRTKQVIASKIPIVFKLIVPLLNIFPFVEFKQLPTEFMPINILYLNQISFKKNLTKNEKTNILNEIIKELFKEDFNMLAYCDFSSQQLLTNQVNFIKHSLNMTLYSVHYKDLKEDILFPISKKFDDEDPGFEMALV
jgi:hypothetical protein